MSQSIEQQVNNILRSLLRDEIRGLPSHSTRAMEAAVTRLLPVDIEIVEDLSYYYEGLFVSQVKACVEDKMYMIKLCVDSGYHTCFASV